MNNYEQLLELGYVSHSANQRAAARGSYLAHSAYLQAKKQPKHPWMLLLLLVCLTLG